MKLVSDFRDYYDFAFDGEGEEFRRLATNFGPSKPEQFKLLADAGWKVPEHGKLWDLLANDCRRKSFVVYDDEMAHRGDGKRLKPAWQYKSNPHMGMPGGDRFYHEKQKFASEFVGDLSKPPASWRYLFVGSRVLSIYYHSKDLWRSNVGEDAECEYMGYVYSPLPQLPYPLYAVDVVEAPDGQEYAVDLNVSPGIRGTGVENVLSPYTVVSEIESWFSNRCL